MTLVSGNKGNKCITEPLSFYPPPAYFQTTSEMFSRQLRYFEPIASQRGLISPAPASWKSWLNIFYQNGSVGAEK